MDEAKINETRLVNLEKDYIGNEFISIISDLNYLKQSFKYIIFEENNYENIANNWKIFSTEKNIYDQIRFIDINGNEKIRINITTEGGIIVPEKLLQNKKGPSTSCLLHPAFYILPSTSCL